MMLLKLNQQLIQGLADVLQQVADLKDATNCCWQRCISVIVYWLSLTVRVLLAMYWHFRGGLIEVASKCIGSIDYWESLTNRIHGSFSSRSTMRVLVDP